MNDIDNSTGQIQASSAYSHMKGDTNTNTHRPVLSNFKELKRPCWKTNSVCPVTKPLFARAVNMKSSAFHQIAASNLAWKKSSSSHLKSSCSSIQSTRTGQFHSELLEVRKGIIRSLFSFLSCDCAHSTVLICEDNHHISRLFGV